MDSEECCIFAKKLSQITVLTVLRAAHPTWRQNPSEMSYAQTHSLTLAHTRIQTQIGVPHVFTQLASRTRVARVQNRCHRMLYVLVTLTSWTPSNGPLSISWMSQKKNEHITE